ncbi:MAG: SGNH/GDSL hydrolase family protein [Candidatus Aureabacteria bacterium]|nr:SGNH/GDSL hydrolase family protein [Candidatus Auribacterota bacterium]
MTASDKRFVVANAGIYGYTSFQGVRRFRSALPLHPDMALISFGGNDPHPVICSDSEYSNKALRKCHLERTLIQWRTGQLLIALMDRLSSSEEGPLRPRVSAQEYRNNLDEMIRIAKERDIPIILLTRPYLGESVNTMWWKTYAPAYRDATIDIAKERGVPLIDLYSIFKSREDCFNDEAHFNEKGHREAARIIYERILPLLPVKSS